MKKSKKKYAVCPCCTTEKYRTEMQKCLSVLIKHERQEYKNFNELGIDSYYSFIDADFEWACDNCLESKKAILANPGLQETPWTPHLAYSDTKLICKTCQQDFLFKKEEKKLWYEAYKLPTYAQPSNCPECRKNIRKQKSENKTLSEILKKPLNKVSNSELEKIIEIYTSWDKLEKAKYYQSILRKRNKTK